MSRYLLDTSVLIDFSKARDPAYSFVYHAINDGDELGVSPINIAEFYAGLRSEFRLNWESFFASLAFWSITLEASRQAGQFRYDYARQGVQLSTSDTLVAAVSIDQDAVLVTHNAKDYPMPGLQLLPL